DVYAYTPQMLRDKNWPYLRVNSRNFWNDPEEMQERITQFIQRQ
ncbi:MAG: hypothetical protein ACI9C9_002094, partial [Marivirga sp.]